jgi:hypothetical protein
MKTIFACMLTVLVLTATSFADQKVENDKKERVSTLVAKPKINPKDQQKKIIKIEDFKNGTISIGGNSGGGGVGVACGFGENMKVTLLDVYESEHVYKFGQPQLLGSLSQKIITLEARFAIAQGGQPDPDFWRIEENITGLFTPVAALELSKDFTKWATLEPDCRYVQIAKFIDPPQGSPVDDLWKLSKIHIVMDLYNRLDDVGKAGLIFHEYVYMAVRWHSAYQYYQGSDDARVLLAALMTDKQDLVLPRYPLGSFGLCQFSEFENNFGRPESLSSFSIQEEKNGVRFYFTSINGYLLVLRSTLFVQGLTLAQLKSGQLASPLEFNIQSDVQLPDVELHTYKIRLEKSGEEKRPLRVVPQSENGMIANGSCS